MKGEDIFNAITDIDEDLVEDADKFKFSKKKKLIPIVASLAACLVLAVGIMKVGEFINPEIFVEDATDNAAEQQNTDIGFTEDMAEQTTVSENLGSLTGGKMNTLSLAIYPERVQYPEEPQGAYTEEYRQKLNLWEDERRELNNLKTDALNTASFTDKVFSEVLSADDGENKLISPMNLYFALGMLSEVTEGNSRQQILSLMGENDINALRTQINSLWQKNYRDDGVRKSILNNSLWLNENLSYNLNTLNSVSENYYASSFSGKMGTKEYDAAINRWINDNTGGLLSPQIETDVNSAMLIASTLFYNTKWQNEFNENNTEEGIFHTPDGEKTAQFMNKSSSTEFYWGEHFQAIYQHLEIGGRMWFILPDEDVRAEDILSDKEVQSLIFSSDEYEKKKHLTVNMSIVKFDVSNTLNLNESLKKLGITDVFEEETADFSPLSDEDYGIFVGKTEHSVRVKIDEEGVLAAAYTVIPLCGSTMPPDEKVDFVLDRPFAFVITLENNTLPLFAGIVNTP